MTGARAVRVEITPMRGLRLGHVIPCLLARRSGGAGSTARPSCLLVIHHAMSQSYITTCGIETRSGSTWQPGTISILNSYNRVLAYDKHHGTWLPTRIGGGVRLRAPIRHAGSNVSSPVDRLGIRSAVIVVGCSFLAGGVGKGSPSPVARQVEVLSRATEVLGEGTS